MSENVRCTLVAWGTLAAAYLSLLAVTAVLG
jgi:hypothetical protein